MTYGKHSLLYLGPFLWSKLDKKVRNLEFLNTFKAKIRKLDLVGLTENSRWARKTSKTPGSVVTFSEFLLCYSKTRHQKRNRDFLKSYVFCF